MLHPKKMFFSFVLFAILGAVLSFMVAPVQAEPSAFQTTPGIEATLVVETPTVSITGTETVPVTGTPNTTPMMWIFFGLIGLLGVVFLIALISGTNRNKPGEPPVV